MSAKRRLVDELRAVFAGRDEIVSIGQISKKDLNRLKWGVKHQLVRIERARWPWKTFGTCTKTYYVLRVAL